MTWVKVLLAVSLAFTVLCYDQFSRSARAYRAARWPGPNREDLKRDGARLVDRGWTCLLLASGCFVAAVIGWVSQ